MAEQAIAAAPDNPDYLDSLGWVLFKRGDLAAAEATLKRALVLAGETASAKEIREHLQTMSQKRLEK